MRQTTPIYKLFNENKEKKNTNINLLFRRTDCSITCLTACGAFPFLAYYFLLLLKIVYEYAKMKRSKQQHKPIIIIIIEEDFQVFSFC